MTPHSNVWQRRFFIVLTLLGWIALFAVILWIISKIITPIILIGFSALLAYLIFPLVRFFQRHMTRILAILLSLLVVLAVVGLILYFVVVAAIQQFGLLIGIIQDFVLHPENHALFRSGLEKLERLGISQNQIHISGQQVIGYLQQTINGVFPLISGVFVTMISLLLVATVAVYFIVDGPRVINWWRYKTPLKYRGFINMFLNELDHSLGDFIRGEVLLATIMSIIVGLGAFIIGVPYVFLLALIVFVCEFIPQIGSYISGAIGIGFALTHSWETALIYGIFVTIMQGGLEGQILAPRILGGAVGLHPILSVFALLVGTTLFGLLGALFAAPAAGILQTFIRSFWDVWRERHPDQFPVEEQKQKPES
ncbi:AI-2E family transporter [Reticulibacter mediterranei]|uniref:AI-2E family transporter n=2 Tax=Reticulibacter mediterranei TaxID=2778369 RepID=A0A8J3N7T2_9CHLR|nr:AI-2E family transporter [Reticulibacter mediterranei]